MQNFIREAAFAMQNKDKWAAFENILSSKMMLNPDKLSDLYIEITDHLSYAKTFYTGSNTENIHQRTSLEGASENIKVQTVA